MRVAMSSRIAFERSGSEVKGFLSSYLSQASDFDKYLITCDELLDFDEDPLDTLVWERYNQLAKAKEQEMV